jgi:hypothetical protein
LRCEAAVLGVRSNAPIEGKKALNMLEPAYRDYMFAECIAIDDLRLKEK